MESVCACTRVYACVFSPLVEWVSHRVIITLITSLGELTTRLTIDWIHTKVTSPPDCLHTKLKSHQIPFSPPQKQPPGQIYAPSLMHQKFGRAYQRPSRMSTAVGRVVLLLCAVESQRYLPQHEQTQASVNQNHVYTPQKKKIHSLFPVCIFRWH